MSFDFLEDQLDDGDSDIGFGAGTKNDPDIDEMMSEAEKRFAKAQYYQAVLKEQIFDADDSQSATEVVAEIRGFVRQRLAVLLGVVSDAPKKEEPAAVFSAEEVKALKAVAAKLTKKPELLEAPPQPHIKKMSGPETPTVKAQRPQAAKSPAPKTTAVKKKDPGTPKTPQGEWLEVDGKKYQKASDKRGEHWVGEDNQKYLIEKNGAGQLFLKNVTPVARPQGVRPLAPLNGDQMSMIAANHVQVAMKQDPVASGAVPYLK
jgi:hypothetical protein